MAIQKRNSELVGNLTPDFVRHTNIQYQFGALVSRFAALPGLVGLWYGGAYQRSTGYMPNLAPYISSASSQDMVLNGTLANYSFDYLDNGTGFVGLPGTSSDYFSVTDNADLDITGLESHIANPGLTIIGWARFPSVGIASNNQAYLAKMNTSGQYSYGLMQTGSSATMIFRISSNGTTQTTVASTSPTIAADTWYCCAGIFVPSSAMKIFVNGQWAYNTTSIPASIHSGSDSLNIGRVFGAQYSTGDHSITALIVGELPESAIESVYQLTKSLYA